MGIFITILVLCIVVTFHELGHFIAARINKVKVDEFAIGMGPIIYKKRGEETLFTVRILPIGGYCKMAGEDDAVEDEKSYSKKSAWQRIMICLSGVLGNILLAFICVLVYLTANFYVEPVVVEVMMGSPAQESGFEVGDKIISVDGMKIKTIDNLKFSLRESRDYMNFTVRRDKEYHDIKVITTTTNENLGSTELGLTLIPTYSSVFSLGRTPMQNLQTVLDLFSDSFRATWNLHITVVDGLVGLFTREVAVEELSGIVGITSVVSEHSSEIMQNPSVESKGSALGWFAVQFAALLSINLGIMNLLPIPALDGGRILLLTIEGVRRKPIKQEVTQTLIAVSYILLMILVVIITFKDISNLL